MNITLKVPSIACEVCANTITKAIQNQDAQAQVSVDIENKIVNVTSAESEAIIKEAILEAGHEIEE